MATINEGIQYKIALPGTMSTPLGDRSVTEYQKSGADAGKYSVINEFGTFYLVLAAQDYETPSDDGFNNIYDVTLSPHYNNGLPPPFSYQYTGAGVSHSVEITNLNDVAPSDLIVAPPAAVPENAAIVAGTKVSSFSYKDDIGATYQIMGDDIALFEIVNVVKTGTTVTGDVVWKVGITPDFEAKNTYDMDVVISDLGTNTSLASPIDLKVIDVNEAPTLTVTSTTALPENTSLSFKVADLDLVDPDTGDAAGATYLVDDARFEVKGDGDLYLKAGQTVSYEDAASIAVKVTATTNGNLSSEVTADIAVTDVFEGGGPGSPSTPVDPVNPVTPNTPNTATIAALVVSNFVNGKIPVDADKLASLSAFAEMQLNAYAAAKVADPNIGPYEALGRGFSTTAEFKAKYDALSEDAFIKASYTEVLGRDATIEQVVHFQAQIDYFQKIYADAKIDDTDATLYAKGAVFGQMIAVGVLEEPAQHQYVAQAAAFIKDASDGKVDYNLALSHWDII